MVGEVNLPFPSNKNTTKNKSAVKTGFKNAHTRGMCILTFVDFFFFSLLFYLFLSFSFPFLSFFPFLFFFLFFLVFSCVGCNSLLVFCLFFLSLSAHVYLLLFLFPFLFFLSRWLRVLMAFFSSFSVRLSAFRFPSGFCILPK